MADEGAPLWKEVVGVVFVLAMFWRDSIHVHVALATDHDPHLADGSDVTLASPVASLRGTTQDGVARLACCSFALICAAILPIGFGDVGSAKWIGGMWLVSNWVVLVVDPLLGLLLVARNRGVLQSETLDTLRVGNWE